MRSQSIAVLAGAAVGVVALAAAAQSSKDWVEIKNPTELRALYSNKTFRFIHAEVGKPAAIHYREDGKGLMVLMGRRYPRTWEIKSGNQVCVSDDIRGTFCYRVMRNSQNPSEILHLPTIGGMGQFMTVEDGIPQF